MLYLIVAVVSALIFYQKSDFILEWGKNILDKFDLEIPVKVPKKILKYYCTGIFAIVVFIVSIGIFSLSYKVKNVQAADNTDPQNIKGINISNNDGNLDLTSAADEGCRFVYLKATEGATFKDSYMDTYYEQCKKLGLKTGAYHYLVKTSSPEEQAQNFYKMISEYDWDLIPMLDVEEYFDGLEDYIKRFKDEFNRLSSLELGIYSYTSFIDEHLNDVDSEIYDMPLWEANYNGEPWSDVGNNNFTKLVGHQYSTEKHIKETIGDFGGDIDEFNDGCMIK